MDSSPFLSTHPTRVNKFSHLNEVIEGVEDILFSFNHLNLPARFLLKMPISPHAFRVGLETAERKTLTKILDILLQYITSPSNLILVKC